MGADWYRNTTWNEEIEKHFNEKLRRARDKSQYLRIQAYTLAQSHPEVALRLSDRYFKFADRFDAAQAYVDRGTALLALGRIEEAIESYQAALARETEFPQYRTQAYLDLPFTIATNQIRSEYSRALKTLHEHGERLTFPVEHFRWHAAQALIAADTDQPLRAKEYAAKALSHAETAHSGFRYHAAIGLVRDEYNTVVQTLRKIVEQV